MAADNRKEKPLCHDVVFENRQELICKESVVRVLDRTASRLCVVKHGLLTTRLAALLRRGEDDPSDSRVLILRTTVYRSTSRLTRWQSGTAMAWPDLPPAVVMEWLAPQIAKGFKRTAVGKSVFAEGSTVRFIARHDLPTAMMDSDIQRAYATFMLQRVPIEVRHHFPRLAEFVSEGGAIMKNLGKTFLVSGGCSIPEGIVKNLLIRTMNGGSVGGWLSDYKYPLNLVDLASDRVWCWYLAFAAEMLSYVEWYESTNPLAVRALSKTEARPSLAFVRHANEADEARCVDAIEERFSRDYHLSNEFDGVHAPVLEATRAAELAARQTLVPIPGVILKDKEVDLWAMLHERFPGKYWDEISHVSGLEYLKHWKWCRDALGSGPESARQRTMYFMKCLYSVLHDKALGLGCDCDHSVITP